MAQADIDRVRLIRYLLGRLSEPEREAVEAEYFDNQDVLSRLLGVEDDLIDAYHGNRLNPEDRRQFEEQVLANPAWRRRVRLVADLRDLASATAIQPTPSRRHEAERADRVRTRGTKRRSMPVPRFLARAAEIAPVVAGSLSLAREGATPTPTIQSTRGTQPAPPLGAPSAGTPTPRTESTGPKTSERPRPAVFSLTLTAGLTREVGDTMMVAVPADAARVRLLLPFTRDDYPQYRASLHTADGEEVANQSRLTTQRGASGPVVAFELPAAALSPRTFIVTLSGIPRDGASEPVSEYVFQVAAR